MFKLRGTWQREIAQLLVTGRHVPATLYLRGRAKNYRGRYQASFSRVINALRQAGYTITLTPGPKGGVTTDAAYWSMVSAS
jgi:tRNA G26 N,N-dimethylase Trm1